jgi:hypothetical protein
MSDNTPMPIATPFTLRTKDVSPGQDGSLQRSLVFSTGYPLDYGAGGIFQQTVQSGVIAAGMTTNAPIFSFRNPSTTLLAALVRIKLAAWSSSAGFAAGLATFNLFVVRNFIVADSGGNAANLTGNSSKLRTAMASAAAAMMTANNGAITAGTRTLDPAPVESWNVAAPTGTLTPFQPTPMKLFEKLQGEHPLILAQNEGVVLQAVVPATGTWAFALSAEWGEVPLF